MEIAFQITIFSLPIWDKIETKMQQNRMHILLTTIGRVQGVKRFEGVLCVPISSVKTADSIGNTITETYSNTDIIDAYIRVMRIDKNRWKVPHFSTIFVYTHYGCLAFVIRDA